MHQLVIEVQDDTKAKLLLELVCSLDFVQSASVRESTNGEDKPEQEDHTDFFDLAGLWEGRNITLETIRYEAWPIR